jgi:glutamate/tyrosine decarboxylase-like PLP-dependent enzyme
VDGAYGAPAAATNRARALFAGLERADSISIDAHKWLYVPVDCSALLLRDPSATRGVFGHADDYVKVLHDDSGEAFAFWDHGFELSRRSRALKLWMTFKAYGAEALARSIEEDIELADLMGQLVRDAEDLELVCEPSLSVCCFRHRPANVADEDLNTHNEALLSALQRDGRAYLSNVTLAGRFALRACITNFRTTNEDIRETVRLVQELGNTVSGRSRSARN